jgi:hypothetical protein
VSGTVLPRRAKHLLGAGHKGALVALLCVGVIGLQACGASPNAGQGAGLSTDTSSGQASPAATAFPYNASNIVTFCSDLTLAQLQQVTGFNDLLPGTIVADPIMPYGIDPSEPHAFPSLDGDKSQAAANVFCTTDNPTSVHHFEYGLAVFSDSATARQDYMTLETQVKAQSNLMEPHALWKQMVQDVSGIGDAAFGGTLQAGNGVDDTSFAFFYALDGPSIVVVGADDDTISQTLTINASVAQQVGTQLLAHLT